MPRVTMKLSAKERKAGVDLRNFAIVEKPKTKKTKRDEKLAPTLLVCSNDIEEIEDEIEEWENSASLDIVKTFDPKKLDEAKKSADASAKGSNVDFVVYEVREIYRAKRGF